MVTKQRIQQYEQKLVPSPGNPRYNEAWALIEAARRIASVIQYGNLDEREDKDKLRAALRLNLRVWTIFQSEQLVGENPLPMNIRQNILTLCKFIDAHTMRAIQKPTAEKAAVLIDINQNIAAGLLGNPDDDTQLAEPEDSQFTDALRDDDAAPPEAPSPLKIDA